MTTSPDAPVPDSSNESPPTHVGHYKIERVLGRGGSGEVFAGYDPRLGRAVAVKRVDARGADGARAQAQLEHAAIPRVYDVLPAGDHAFVIGQLVDGVSLAAVLRAHDGAGLPVRRACELLGTVAAALAHAHGCGIVHHDLKLENILVDADGGAKLIDFGLARGRSDNMSLGLAGTLATMSPEQSWGESIDERSDIFSLGVCFYEALSGRNPFVAAHPAATLHNLRTAVALPLHAVRSDVPEALSALVDRMLAKRAADRPSADAIVRALQALRLDAGRAPQATRIVRAPQVAVATVRFADRPAEAIAALRAHLSATLDDLGGTLALSAGSMVAFVVGHPQAHEHNAELAARVAGELVRSNPGSCAAIGVGPASFVESSTGVFAVGQVLDDALALGQQAAAGEVVLTAAAAGTLARSFEVDGGKEDRNRVHPRLGPARGESRTSATALVGRTAALASLDRAWRHASEGRGRAVIVAGEAGIGKTRLLDEWLASAEAPPRLLTLTGFEHGRQTPLSGWRALAGPLLGIDGSDGLSLAEALARRGLDHPAWIEAATLLFEPAETTAGKRPTRWQSGADAYERLGALLTELLRDTATVLRVEDAHWLDAATLAVLGRVCALARRHPLLVLISARPELEARWRTARDLEWIALGRLEPHEATAMIASMGVAGHLPPRVVHSLVQHAGGLPLVLEQLAVGASLQPPARLADHDAVAAMPTSLRDSVQRRVDGLGRTRDLLERLAVLGDDMPMELVRAVCGLDADELARRMDEAQRVELIATGPTPRFRHALIAAAVYDGLDPQVRTQLHGRVAQTLTTRFETLLDEAPGSCARHFAVAGDVARAIDLYEAAGVAALHRWAYEESERHLDAARRLVLERIEASPDRDRRERALLRSVYPAKTATRGWNDPTVRELLARGTELDARLGDAPALGGLWGQWIMSLISHTVPGVEAALAAMRDAGDSPQTQFLHDLALGVTSYHRGDLDRARACLTAARDRVLGTLEGRLEPDAMLDLAAASGWSQEVLASPSLYLAVIATCCGRFDEWERLQQEAESIARAIESPYAMSFALGCRTINGLLHRDTVHFRATLPELEALCAGDADWLVFARAQLAIARGSIAVEEGRAPAGVAELAQGAAILTAMGFKTSSELHAAAVAEAYLAAGDLDAAEAALAPGLAIVDHELAGIYAPLVWNTAAQLAHRRGDATAQRDHLARAERALASIRSRDEPPRWLAERTRHLA